MHLFLSKTVIFVFRIVAERIKLLFWVYKDTCWGLVGDEPVRSRDPARDLHLRGIMFKGEPVPTIYCTKVDGRDNQIGSCWRRRRHNEHLELTNATILTNRDNDATFRNILNLKACI